MNFRLSFLKYSNISVLYLILYFNREKCKILRLGLKCSLSSDISRAVPMVMIRAVR